MLKTNKSKRLNDGVSFTDHNTSNENINLVRISKSWIYFVRISFPVLIPYHVGFTFQILNERFWVLMGPEVSAFNKSNHLPKNPQT